MDNDAVNMSISNDKISDVKTLEAFQAAMACGSMTAAAKQLGIGQPAVTRQIKELEESVGFPLFHRNGPRISPTERGLQFYGEVQRLMAGLHQIRERAAAIRDGQIAAIDIAATPTMAGGLLSPTLARMGLDLPGVVNIETMNAEHVARALTSRTADFGLSALPFEHATLEAKVICESRLVAAVAKGGASDSEEPLPLEALAAARLLTVGNAYRIRGKINGALKRQDIVPAAEIVTNSSLNAMMAARAGLGIAIIDPVTAFGIPVDGVSIRPLAVDLPYIWGLFSAAGRVLPAELLSFVAGFEAACSTTIPDCVFHDPSDIRALERSSL